MSRSRAPEMPQQRQSTNAALHLKTGSSDSGGVHAHHRGSPKLEDSHRRSPRSPLPDQSPGRNQRKGGSRVGDLETKLEHAQEELRKLREQLASAEAAKRDAQQELKDAKNLIPPTAGGQETELVPAPAEPFSEKEDNGFNVKMAAEDVAVTEKEEGKEEAMARQEKTETIEVEAKLAAKMEELQRSSAESSTLRKQLAEAEADAAAARAREEEMVAKLNQAAEKLAQSKARAQQLEEQLEAAEGTKASLEAEMKRVRIQTEQWRKAADAAAAVLSAPQANGLRVAERCPSRDKHLRMAFGGGLGSPLVAGERRRKAAGIRVLGDLWKKKGQPHK